jgi:XRE family transcriptional regulator, regulator of sulfur utilization
VRGDEDHAFLMDVGLRIRVARTGRRLSQDQLAELAGVSRVTLGSIERGEHPATISTIRSLSMALGLSLSMLFDETDALGRLIGVTTRRASTGTPEQSEGLSS